MKPEAIAGRAENLKSLLGLQYRNEKRFLAVCVVGALMITSGVLFMHYQPLHALVASQLTLAPGTLLAKFLGHPPVEVSHRIFVFNVTNAAAFLAGAEKLRVAQVGPYTYMEDVHNTDAVFNANGTLTFTTRRYLAFRRDLSVGDPRTDTIISPNIPLLGMSSFMRDKSTMANLVLAQIANVLNSPQFLNLTVEQYLWGYDDKLVTLAHRALPNWINFPRFGIYDRLMALDNASNTVTIKSDDAPLRSALLGGAEWRTPYTVVSFNGSPEMPQWSNADDGGARNASCSSLEGVYETGLFDLRFVTPTADIWFYRHAFCRAVPMQYEGRASFEGFAASVVRMRADAFALPAESARNACYCRAAGARCRHRGLGYVSPCYYGIPIALSQPHFLNADAALAAQVEGMRPERRLHDTYIYISETVGMPVHARMRIQINLDVDTRLSSRCKPLNGLMLPLFWVELGTHSLGAAVYAANYGIRYALPIASALLAWLLVVFGAAAVAAATLLTFYSRPQPAGGFEELYDRKARYAPIRRCAS